MDDTTYMKHCGEHPPDGLYLELSTPEWSSESGGFDPDTQTTVIQYSNTLHPLLPEETEHLKSLLRTEDMKRVCAYIACRALGLRLPNGQSGMTSSVSLVDVRTIPVTLGDHETHVTAKSYRTGAVPLRWPSN